MRQKNPFMYWDVDQLRPELRSISICWALMMVATAVATFATATDRSGLLTTAAEGLYLGQFALAAIIGGLYGRTWIAGWLLSVALAIAATLICCVVDTLTSRNFNVSLRLALCSYWPILMLGACAPMALMRRLRGWSLTLGNDTAIRKEASTIEDLFLLSVVVASCISFTKWMEEIIPGFTSWQGLAITSYFFSFSLLFVLPATAITFRTRTWTRRLLGWLAMTLVVALACIALNLLFNGSSNLFRSLVEVGVAVPIAALTMMYGGWTLVKNGVKLTHFARITPLTYDSDLPANEVRAVNDLNTGIRRVRLQTRLLTGLVAISALISVMGLSLINYRKLAFLRFVQQHDEQTHQNGFIDLTIRGDNVVGAKLAPSTTAIDLERYRNSRNEIERLSLSGTKITDAAIEKLRYFPKLKHLDLSNTAITNAGLEKLVSYGKLITLSVANTNVDFDVALHVAQSLEVKNLDVSGNGITDDQLHDQLPFHPISSLNLSHNPITDAGLSKLLQNPNRLWKLDVSDTSVNGSGLISAKCPASLNLDGTNITDANLISILKPGICKEVSIRRTGITAAVLPTIAPRFIKLSLGEGLITEQDLANLTSASFSWLSLNDKKFTGECLRSRKIAVQSLDLSNSGVTDQSLRSVAKLNRLRFLDLSNTDITDEGLIWVKAGVVDIRKTNVTPAGIRSALSAEQILVDHYQFTPEEQFSLRTSRVFIDGDKPGDSR